MPAPVITKRATIQTQKKKRKQKHNTHYHALYFPLTLPNLTPRSPYGTEPPQHGTRGARTSREDTRETTVLRWKGEGRSVIFRTLFLNMCVLLPRRFSPSTTRPTERPARHFPPVGLRFQSHAPYARKEITLQRCQCQCVCSATDGP